MTGRSGYGRHRLKEVNVNKQHSRRKRVAPKHAVESISNQAVEAQARQKVRKLWQHGDLFHMCTRYPRKAKAPRVDRLAGILRGGLIAPACCRDGSVFS